MNRWVFKWRLNVETLLHSLMSAGKEFQIDGAATEKARRASSVCVRVTTSSGALDGRRSRVGTSVCTRWAWSAPCASVEAPCRRSVDDSLSHWKPMERPEQRPGVGATPAVADDSGQVVLGALQFVECRRRCSA